MDIVMTPRRKAKVAQYLIYLVRTGQVKVLNDTSTSVTKKERDSICPYAHELNVDNINIKQK